jgi:transcriptional antiterminator RfaH
MLCGRLSTGRLSMGIALPPVARPLRAETIAEILPAAGSQARKARRSRVSSIEPIQRWFVAHTHPRGEERAITNLERQGFATYLPRYLKRRRHARKVEMVPAPLFPRYVFVAIDIERQRWLAIRSTIGVSRLVGDGELPMAVPEGIVEGLMSRQDAEGFLRLSAPRGLKPGDRVRVLGGAFEDTLGLFEHMTDEQRITILLDLMGRKVRVTLGSELIAAA